MDCTRTQTFLRELIRKGVISQDADLDKIIEDIQIWSDENPADIDWTKMPKYKLIEVSRDGRNWVHARLESYSPQNNRVYAKVFDEYFEPEEFQWFKLTDGDNVLPYLR